ncbi:hypothetical protein BIW11_07626 [Tropilaelaps mercedesae]|uniref:Uncharacterized protein n=1 Tax=Tropilaelaps mercedesae TaxID=418985 RepID=A0A1V9XT49_9ACAR|nr:hypothetical protein BIW11_07626 [Tropilaelaps mercedesae]
MTSAEKSGLVSGHVTRRSDPASSMYGTIRDEYKTRGPAQPSFYLTCRDCVIVTVVVGMALAAIVVSLVLGLPALEAKRRELLNSTMDAAEVTTDLVTEAFSTGGA